MPPLNIFFVLAGLLAISLVLYFVASKDEKESEYPYRRFGPLLTAAEKNFYLVLKEVVPKGFVITFKVRIGDVLKVEKGLDKQRAFVMRGKVQQKHFDFVICREDDLNVACCIELNDSSHNRPERIKRDIFVRGACKAAGVTLLEIKNQRKYNVNEIRKKVRGAIKGVVVDLNTASPVPVAGSKQLPKESDEPSKTSSSDLAKRFGISNDKLTAELVDSMYLELSGKKYELTEFGVKMGGEKGLNHRSEFDFMWPDDLPLSSVDKQ